MRRSLLALTVTWLAVSAPSRNDAQTLPSVWTLGIGGQSCGRWNESRAGRDAASEIVVPMATAWTQGFVSAMVANEAVITIIRDGGSPDARDSRDQHCARYPTDVLCGFLASSRRFGSAPDAAALQSWLDNYCRSNPLQSINRAALALTSELAPTTTR